MPLGLQLAQDGAGRGSGDVGHVREVFVTDVDFDGLAVAWTDEATIPEAEQDGNETLVVVAYHQVVGSSHREIEVTNRNKTKEPPRRRGALDDFTDGRQR